MGLEDGRWSLRDTWLAPWHQTLLLLRVVKKGEAGFAADRCPQHTLCCVLCCSQILSIVTHIGKTTMCCCVGGIRQHSFWFTPSLCFAFPRPLEELLLPYELLGWRGETFERKLSWLCPAPAILPYNACDAQRRPHLQSVWNSPVLLHPGNFVTIAPFTLRGLCSAGSLWKAG